MCVSPGHVYHVFSTGLPQVFDRLIYDFIIQGPRPPLKKGLLPVQRVAEIMATLAVENSLFFPSLFFW